jgi:DNA-binding transcriptional ArsR family regulator
MARKPATVLRLEQLDSVMSALAHPMRRQILLVVHLRGGSLSAGEIAARFSCTWPTTSRHLRRLREAGLVGVTRRGRAVVYTLEHDVLRLVRGWLSELGV